MSSFSTLLVKLILSLIGGSKALKLFLCFTKENGSLHQKNGDKARFTTVCCSTFTGANDIVLQSV